MIQPVTGAKETCELVKTREFFLNFAGKDLCGRCRPCPQSTGQVMEILKRLARGEGQEQDINLLRLISAKLPEVALCKRGKEAAGVLADSLASGEYEEHLREKRCPEKSCEELTTYRVIAEKCTMCGKCKEACPEGAIFGEEYLPYLADNAPYTIKAERCNKCGLCLPVCAQGAIELV